MGMYDTILVPCPNCGQRYDTQTKSGPCLLNQWFMEDTPQDALRDVNRHAPFECWKCGTVFHVDLEVETGLGLLVPNVVAEKVGFELIPIEGGDLMTVGKFIDDVNSGYLSDFDGFGYYSDGKKMIRFHVYPLDVLYGKVNTAWTHVVWFNK